MHHRFRSGLARYGAAVAIILLAALVRYWFDEDLQGSGFAFMLAAVVIAAWYGGLGPSLVALVLSTVISAIYFRAPPDAPPEPLVRVATGLAVFFFTGVTTALLSESMRAARRKAEAQAQEAVAQREQLRTTLACISDAVIVTDRSGRLTMMNAVAEELTGWKGSEAVGLPLEEVFRIRSESSGQPAESPEARALRDESHVGLTEHCLLTARDGTVRPIDASAAPVRDTQGTMNGAVQIFRDVTLRRQAEEAQRNADRRKDEFLATLAHELRNPLSPVLSAVQLLQLREVPDEHARWSYDVIQRQVQHLTRLIDDLLDISRITQDKLELRKETVDLKSIAAAAVEMSLPSIQDRGHRLSVALPSEQVHLHGDRVRLTQVLMNLLDNAAKYTDPGGQIDLTAHRQGDEVAIRVSDTGRGIPPEKLAKLFEMFYQIEGSPSGGKGGLGIGLALVRRLTEMHGGRIAATSDGPGQGSQFEVRLPVTAVASQAEPVEPEIVASAPASVRRRVLVVDDNKDAADSLKMILCALGHEVHTAYDGQQGIEQAASVRPEVVFLDLGMPKLNGFDAARMIRKHAWGKELRLVAITGWGQEEDRSRSRAAGFDDHLAKPVELLALQAILSAPSNLLGRHGGSRATTAS